MFFVLVIFRRRINKGILEGYEDYQFFNSEDGQRLRNAIKLGLAKLGSEYRIDEFDGYNYSALTSAKLNEELTQGKHLRYRTLTSPWIYYGSQHYNNLKQWVILEAYSRGAIVFNSKKIRVASDVSTKTRIINLQKTDYVEFLLGR